MAMGRGYIVVVCVLAILAGGSFTPALAALDSWRLVVQNGGVSAMHMATAHTDKVIIFDATNFGKSAINLPNGTCRDNPQELVLKHDCTAHSIEYDSITDAIRPLMIQTDTICSAGAFLPCNFLCTCGDKTSKFYA